MPSPQAAKTGTLATRKMLAWTLVLGLLFGLVGFGEIFDDALRIARNKAMIRPASGEVVVVAIDDAALRQHGAWPWSREHYARLVDRLTDASADKVLIDVAFPQPWNERTDRHFARALERAGNVSVAMLVKSNAPHQASRSPLPPPEIARRATLVDISVFVNYASMVWRVPYGWTVEDRTVPSLSASAAGVDGPAGREYRLNYAIDPDSIPLVSAGDVLDGKLGRGALRGKTVIVGPTSIDANDRYQLPGYGWRAGLYHHAIGAETLKRGRPVDLGWWTAFIVAVAFVLLATRAKTLTTANRLFAAGTVVLLALPFPLEARHFFVDTVAGLFTLASAAISINWRHYRQRGWTDPLTGLPNFAAMRAQRDKRNSPLVAARVHNFTAIASLLTAEQERQLVEQIIARLRVGDPDRLVYHSDEGLFAWFADDDTPVASQMEALHALFRSAARVAGRPVDLSLTFGVEAGSGRSNANRLGSALAAAEEAAQEGLKWKYHDPSRLQDMSWRLSLLSQLDHAIENGEVWVAYQPQVEVKSGRIIGAEALARWTHPEKGPISPIEFVTAAEQGGRIDKLTDFVLDQAIATAAEINQAGVEFDIAVNLSARLLSNRRLPLQVAAMLSRHGLDARRLTLELTETAALADSSADIELLSRLRDLGISISIDDYGTGLSTLEYLRKVPANEIKIDQSFIRGMADNRSDRMMVQSTIALAHSLGRKIVAEGVEDKALLDLLKEMECDVVQGFAIGRPTSAKSIVKKMMGEKRRRVA